MSTKKRKAPSSTPPYRLSAKSIKEAGLPKYLSCIIDGKLPELLEQTTKKWGDNPGDIMTADKTVKVLIEAVKKVNPQDYVVIPESFMLYMNPMYPTEYQTEQTQRIDKILNQHKDKKEFMSVLIHQNLWVSHLIKTLFV
jgi:hypothetical protein